MNFAHAAAIFFVSASLVTAPSIAIALKDAKAEQQASVKQPKPSKEALKDLQALDAAVKAKDAGNIPALLAAAKASAKTPDDRYLVGQISLTAAIDSKDKAATLVALQTIVDSGYVAPNDMYDYHLNIGRLQYELNNLAAAESSLSNALRLKPDSVDALASLSDTYNRQKRSAEAFAAVRKAISIKSASGPVDERWFRHAAAIAINSKLPESVDASLQWVKAYPNPSSWSEALKNLQRVRNMEPGAAIDVSRLLYAAGAMQSENDYYRYALAASGKGLPGEAKAVLEAGFAAGKIEKNSEAFGPLYVSVSAKAKGDRESLAAAAKTALAAPTPRQAVIIGDAYYGYGDYAQAISLYRAALNKAGVDKDLVNLHLGMALARSGDKAGAKEALAAVGGAQAEVAKFWLAYVDTLS